MTIIDILRQELLEKQSHPQYIGYVECHALFFKGLFHRDNWSVFLFQGCIGRENEIAKLWKTAGNPASVGHK